MGRDSGRPDFQKVADFIGNDFSLWEIVDREVPVFLSVASPRTAQATGAKPRLPSGRGLWRSQALMSAAAEALELVSVLARPDRTLGGTLKDSEGRQLCRAMAISGSGSLDVLAQEVILDYAAVHGEPLTVEADTSGCAAGSSLEDAQTRAVLELIERDAVSAWWYGRHRRRKLSLSSALSDFPRLLAHCETRSRHTQLLDISTDVHVQCVAAVSWDAQGGNIAIGSAAHHHLEIAALSALTEMYQTEASFHVSGEGNADLEKWIKTVSIGAFPHLLGSDQPADGLYHQSSLSPLDALREAGFQVYSIDFTLPGAPLRVVRAIVPGLTGLGRHKREDRIRHLQQSLRWTPEKAHDRDFDVIDPY